MSRKGRAEGLPRIIGVASLATTVVNFSIGAGIFVLPAVIGIQLGTASLIGYVSCALVFAAIILCYMEIGSRVKGSGGSYAYVDAAFGPFAGFIVNWLFFFGWGIIGDAAIMNIVADALGTVFPLLAKNYMRVLLFATLIALMMAVNIRSNRQGLRLLNVFTFIKILPLLIIIVFGLGHIRPGNLAWQQLPPLKAFEDTALILFFAFAGFETSLNVSGEIKDPARTIPRGLLLGGLAVLVIYMLIQIITQGVLGAELSLHRDTPLAAVAEKIMGSAGATLLLFAAVMSGLNAVNGDVFSSSRLLFAGARDGLFPRPLGKIHPRFGTPYWAVIIYALLIFIFCVSGGFRKLAILASGALLLVYLAVVMAMIQMRRKKNEEAGKTFSVRGGLTVPVIAIIAILWVLSNLSLYEILSLIVFIAALCLVFLFMRRRVNHI